ncbi:hypothetical protein KIN20_002715 [Parelaphostrongylus tenuis]|uniref:Uncharacterized protein n=1 Tax=Parelaphostrongylus tenuis TaxID=148309 RepID=A0AAD5MEL9_PARTN|nr:hypothetical protein KIN20_002715 [Parelaphostrongylus tenuis]
MIDKDQWPPLQEIVAKQLQQNEEKFALSVKHRPKGREFAERFHIDSPPSAARAEHLSLHELHKSRNENLCTVSPSLMDSLPDPPHLSVASLEQLEMMNRLSKSGETIPNSVNNCAPHVSHTNVVNRPIANPQITPELTSNIALSTYVTFRQIPPLLRSSTMMAYDAIHQFRS